MFDPVNNFHIPDEWVRRSNLPYNELESRILSGRNVLLSNGSLLMRGYTTGTTAAAAAKAAILSLFGEVSEIEVPTPSGVRLKVAVCAKNGTASAKKFSGDYTGDVTDGLEIVARACENENISIIAGEGIGRKNNIPAINNSPMHQIEDSMKEALIETGLQGAKVIISIPDGEKIAKKTLNEKIGVKGGISILGTTGFVEPWNEHLGLMKQELIRNAKRVVLTTGRIGMRYSMMFFPDYEVILIGSDISRAIAAAAGEVIICGLPGLILKWADPDILRSTGFLTFQEMIEAGTGSSIIDIALDKAARRSGRRVVLLNRNGTILRDSDKLNLQEGMA